MQTRRRVHVPILATIGFLVAAGSALAGAAPAGPPPPHAPARIQAAAALPDWSGAWAPNQADVFDARTATAPADARSRPPYNPQWEAKYVATLAKLKTTPQLDPLQDCYPLGLLRMMSATGHYEFAVTPEQVWIFSGTPAGPKSSGAQTRRIYTDGRDNLKGDDLFPQYTGNSVGRWEGDTLVVTTVGLNDTSFIDRTGAQLSGDAVVKERIRLVRPDTLEDQFTIEDKTALTRPWVVTRTWRRLPKGTPVVDDSCLGKRVNPAALVDAAKAKQGR